MSRANIFHTLNFIYYLLLTVWNRRDAYTDKVDQEHWEKRDVQAGFS